MRGVLMSLLTTTVLIIGLTSLLYAADAGEKAPKPATGPTSQPASRPASQPASQPAKTEVVIETNMGEIVVELDAQRTPATVKNFLAYVDEEFYDGIVFHRIMKNFMIQAGGITTEGSPKRPTHPPVVNESRKAAGNTRGTIAMARTSDPNSATSQFFINHKDNRQLDTYGGGYTAFGRVVKGMDIVDKIADVPVRPNETGESSQPTRPVVIKSIRRK